MKYYFIFIILIIALILQSQEKSFIQEKSYTQGKEIISLEKYINSINEKLPQVKLTSNDVESSKKNLAKSYSAYDVNFIGSFNGIGKKTYPDGNQTEIDYSTGFKGDGIFYFTLPSGTKLLLGSVYSQTYTYGTTTSQDLQNASGMGMTMSGPIIYIDPRNISEREDDFVSTVWEPIIKVGISQPLIYNWFGFLDRFAQKDAKNKVEIEKLKKFENDKEILNYYKKLYFLWVQWIEILKYLEKTIEAAKKLETQTLEKVNSNVAETDELERVRYSLNKYIEQFKSIKGEYQLILNELSLFVDVEKVLPSINEFEDYYIKIKNSQIEFVDYEMTTNSKIIKINKENLELTKKAKTNQLLPQLNLNGNLDIKFHQYRKDPRNDSDKEIEYDMSNGDIDFIIGLEFKYPLGNIKTRNELKEIELSYNEIILQDELTRNNYSKILKNTITGISSLEEVIEVKSDSIKSLNKRYTAEKNKHRQARLELSTLIETENLIINEEIDLMRKRAGLILFYLDYMKLIN